MVVTIFMRKNKWVLRGGIAGMVLVIICTGPAGAQSEHWASGPVQALLDMGVGGQELKQVLEIDRLILLDSPISPLQWRQWVRQALTAYIGVNLASDGDTSFWVDTYTVPEYEGPRSVLSRGYAVAGLMKIGNLLGFIPGSSQGQLVHLQKFSDWHQVAEQGFSGPWELMLVVGVVSGYPDGTLRPEAPLTRAEAACLLKSWLDVYNSTMLADSIQL